MSVLRGDREKNGVFVLCQLMEPPHRWSTLLFDKEAEANSCAGHRASPSSSSSQRDRQVAPSTESPFLPPPPSERQAEAAKMQVKVCNEGPTTAPRLTELWGCAIALWEALWRGKPSRRGGHDVRREWRGRWWGSSSRRGWSVAT